MMKHVLALVVGVLVGALAVSALLVYNPLAGTRDLTPLSVSDQTLMQLNYSGVAEASIAYTNDGESTTRPHPAKVLQLWEGPVRRTDAMMTVLSDARGRNVGFGIKYMSDSEKTNIINGDAIVDSVWHIVLPGRGTLFVEQTENYWGFLRDVVLPAHLSAADSWKGNWSGNMTAGPGALGTARVIGGSGEFAERTAEAVESRTAKAYSTRQGAIALDGQIMIEMGEQALAADNDAP
ncbi:MAG: hypothetical protein QNJ05_12070 [Woeseiaceae bacterium]|nr:hypothetical protein [Woeseiaceae bacterium]